MMFLRTGLCVKVACCCFDFWGLLINCSVHGLLFVVWLLVWCAHVLSLFVWFRSGSGFGCFVVFVRVVRWHVGRLVLVLEFWDYWSKLSEFFFKLATCSLHVQFYLGYWFVCAFHPSSSMARVLLQLISSHDRSVRCCF